MESLVFILRLTRRGSTLAHGNIEPVFGLLIVV